MKNKGLTNKNWGRFYEEDRKTTSVFVYFNLKLFYFLIPIFVLPLILNVWDRFTPKESNVLAIISSLSSVYYFRLIVAKKLKWKIFFTLFFGLCFSLLGVLPILSILFYLYKLFV